VVSVVVQNKKQMQLKTTKNSKDSTKYTILFYNSFCVLRGFRSVHCG